MNRDLVQEIKKMNLKKKEVDILDLDLIREKVLLLMKK